MFDQRVSELFTYFVFLMMELVAFLVVSGVGLVSAYNNGLAVRNDLKLIKDGVELLTY